MTQHPTIYRLDNSHPKIKETTDLKLIVKTIVNSHYETIESNLFFDEENMSSTIIDGKEYLLYLASTSTYQSDWKDFLPEALSGSHEFAQKNLVLILFIKAEFDTYCIIGGKAYRFIVPFIDHSFGIKTYTKIGEPSEDDLISINSRGMTGFLSGAKELFRDDFKVRDYIKFGKIANKIHIKLSKSISQIYFNHLTESINDRIQIEAGSGIKFKKGVSFDDLSDLISDFEDIKGLADQWDLSSYEIISDREFINMTLKPVLEREIYNDSSFVDSSRIPAGGRFQFDFCNPNNFEKFYEADSYVLKQTTEKGGKRYLTEIVDRESIYETAIRYAINEVGNTKFFEFKEFLWSLHVSAIKAGKTTVSSSFMYHISAEVKVGKSSYFFLDAKWYKIQNSFIDDLATDCTALINGSRAPEFILSKKWDKSVHPTEGLYNMSYDTEPSHIVMDTIIVEGFEPCDVMIINDDRIFLCHVKYGFKASLRELYNQIALSAKRFRELASSGNKSLLNKIYKALRKKGRSTCGYSESEFIDLFQKPITMVLAFASHTKHDLDVGENLDRYTSNIARYSLVQGIRELRLYSGQVLVKQIKKS